MNFTFLIKKHNHIIKEKDSFSSGSDFDIPILYYFASPMQFPFLNSGHTTKPKFLRTSHSVTFPYFSNNSRRSSERQLLPRLPINIFVGMVTVYMLIYLKNKAHVSYEKIIATVFLTHEKRK